MNRLEASPWYLRHVTEPMLDIARVLETLLPRTQAKPHKKTQEIPFIPQLMVEFPTPSAPPAPKREPEPEPKRSLRPRKRVRYT